MGNPTRKAERNTVRALQLENAMYDERSRYLILVLTLGYHSECQNIVTLDTIQQHRNQLFNNCRSNTLLKGINGYVWKIEEGHHGGGLHLHVALFYNGQHRADVHIAQRIGEYWKTVITHGMGTYWNSNAQKEHHARYGHGIGTGQIDRHDEIKREALRQNLRYLAKDDQCVKTRTSPHLRTFGTSQFPN